MQAPLGQKSVSKHNQQWMGLWDVPGMKTAKSDFLVCCNITNSLPLWNVDETVGTDIIKQQRPQYLTAGKNLTKRKEEKR